MHFIKKVNEDFSIYILVFLDIIYSPLPCKSEENLEKRKLAKEEVKKVVSEVKTKA